jgi:hypothetical protein
LAGDGTYQTDSELIGRAAQQYNMEMLFTDFLCYRGPEMGVS